MDISTEPTPSPSDDKIYVTPPRGREKYNFSSKGVLRLDDTPWDMTEQLFDALGMRPS